MSEKINYFDIQDKRKRETRVLNVGYTVWSKCAMDILKSLKDIDPLLMYVADVNTPNKHVNNNLKRRKDYLLGKISYFEMLKWDIVYACIIIACIISAFTIFYHYWVAIFTQYIMR